MIEISDLSYIYPKDHLVLSNLSLTVNEGEFWGILGRNGAGKSTLIDLILGIKHPTSGEVLVLGAKPNITKSDDQNDVVFLSQDVKLKGDITVEVFLNFHSVFYPNYSKELESELLAYFQVPPQGLIGSMSTGQQKKVQIVAGLASNTKIILIDEITAVLDPEARHLFFKKIAEFNKNRNKTVLLATNIAEDLESVATNILYINDHKGMVLAPSALKTIFTSR